jgi:integrase
MAREWLRLLALGRDPQLELTEQRRRASAEQSLTFNVAAEHYITDRLRGKRQGARSANEIRSELVVRWASRPLTSISRADVIRLVDDLKARAQRNAGNRASGAYARIIFSHCRALFSWAAIRYELERLPTDRLRPKDLGLIARPRQRVLNDGEIACFWRATAQMGAPFGVLCRLLLMLGARRGELANAHWSEIDLTAQTWTVPRHRAKADAEHCIPLSIDALELLATLPRYRSGDHVFSTTYGRRPISGFSAAAARLHRLMGSPPPFCLHDLRRTCRTKLSELKVAEHVAEAVLAHSKTGIKRVYDLHRHADEVREALEQWHRKLRGIIEPAAANVNVVALRG